MAERRYDVADSAGSSHVEVVESFTTVDGREVLVVRGLFPNTDTGDADAELFAQMLRALSGCTTGWAEAIRENGLALGDKAEEGQA